MGDGLYPLGPLEVRVEDGVARLVEGGSIAGSTLTLDTHSSGAESYIEIWVTGEFKSSGTSQIILKPGVHVTYYIEGNIKVTGTTFVNESNVAGNNLINAVTPPTGTIREMTFTGGGDFIGAINAPAYNFTATGNFNVTAGLATITFFSIIIAGTMAHGFIKHWSNLVPHGLPLPLYILLVPMELLGMFVRPFALTMRLAANMTGGHIAILAIMSFVFIFANMLGPIGGIGIGLGFSVPVATAVMSLEIIVVLVQAYVFTLLTAVFIGMAIHVHH